MSCWVETWTLSIFPALGKIAEAISFDGIFYSLFVSVGIMKFANTKSMEKAYLWVHITQEQNQLRSPNFDAVVTTMCRTNCSVFNTGLRATLKLQICYTYEYGPFRKGVQNLEKSKRKRIRIQKVHAKEGEFKEGEPEKVQKENSEKSPKQSYKRLVS